MIQNEEDNKGDHKEDTDKISEESVSTGGGNQSNNLKDNNSRERLYSIHSDFSNAVQINH
jgi:hypothetical protein